MTDSEQYSAEDYERLRAALVPIQTFGASIVLSGEKASMVMDALHLAAEQAGEREAVVAYLRTWADEPDDALDPSDKKLANEFADLFERGDHRKEQP